MTIEAAIALVLLLNIGAVLVAAACYRLGRRHGREEAGYRELEY